MAESYNPLAGHLQHWNDAKSQFMEFFFLRLGFVGSCKAITDLWLGSLESLFSSNQKDFVAEILQLH